MNQAESTLELPRFRNNTRKRKAKPSRFPALLLFIFVCVTAWLIGAYMVSYKKQEAMQSNNYSNYIKSLSQDNYLTDNISEKYKNPVPAAGILTYEQLARISNSHLILTNEAYAAPETISDGFVNVTDYVWTLNRNILMNKDALEMLSKMFASAADAGYDAFRVTDGYRTYKQQSLLYDSIKDKLLVALPGHSEHQLGLAADISYHSVNIANSIQGTWLMENAYKYGFILRYPKHKAEETGFPFEPWHYRFVGQPHAYFIYKNDLVLEEYIDFLKTQREIAIDINGVEYSVHYLCSGNEKIEIPQNCFYSASLDNTGGVIVTVSRKLKQ